MIHSAQIIQTVQDGARAVGGMFRKSREGCPHVLIHRGSLTLSLVYAARTKKWKIFYPWPSSTQTRVYFRDLTEVKTWLDKEGYNERKD